MYSYFEISDRSLTLGDALCEICVNHLLLKISSVFYYYREKKSGCKIAAINKSAIKMS